MTKYYRPMMAITGMMITANMVQAATSNCSEVAAELRAMQAAQKSISISLISNHDSFSSMLEEYADNPQAKLMRESAKAYRARGESAQKLNNKFNEASEQVITKAINCLKTKN